MSFHVLFAVLIVNFILLLIFFFEAINTNHFDTALTCHSYLFFLKFLNNLFGCFSMYSIVYRPRHLNYRCIGKIRQ